MLYVYCGSNRTPMNVTFDTGSSWLILQTTACSACTGSVWDTSESTTFTSGASMTQDYGSATTVGLDSTDQFYLDTSYTFGLSSFEFEAITSGSGISPSGGIMGFGRNLPFTYNGTDYYDSGPLFYQGLYNESTISAQIFSIYYADYPDQSFYTLGDYDTAYTYYTDDITWISVQEQMYWMSTITGVAIGKKQYALSAEGNIILDSGTSLAYMPSADGKKIIKKILKGTGFNFKLFGEYFVNCDTTKYSSFYILMDGYWVEIPPEAYIFDLGGRFCLLGFGLMDIYGDYLFGDVLLRSYYTVWDDDNSYVGFTPRTGSSAGSITAGTTPKKNL